MKPAEKYTVKKSKSKDDEEDRYRFSARQVRERANLNQKIQALLREPKLNLLRWQSWIEQGKIDKEFSERLASRHWLQLFYLADPWNLLGTGTHRLLEQELTAALEEDAESAPLLLARGTVRHSLQDFEAATIDFKNAARADSRLARVAQACEARTMVQRGNEIEGRRQLAQMAKVDLKDPYLPLVQALVELDQGRFPAADRHLQEALERGIDPAEVHRVLALMFAAGPESQPHSARRAIEHARRACMLTGWLDSETLLSLAAAHAEAGEFDTAKEMAGLAAGMAVADVQERAHAWQEIFAKGKRLRLNWGWL